MLLFKPDIPLGVLTYIVEKETNMKYKQLVAQISNLRWDLATPPDLLGIMILSAYAAKEFAESLRIALAAHAGNHAFQEMAAGELEANNLRFDDYVRPGDHANFLWHFIGKHGVFPKCPSVLRIAGHAYTKKVRALDQRTRIMSIVSREQELPGIFTSILKAKGWDEYPELQAFRYYLEQHIALDSGEGGHADLLSGFEVDDTVADFYEARLDMYRVIPALFVS